MRRCWRRVADRFYAEVRVLALETIEQAGAAYLDPIEHAFERFKTVFQIGIGDVHAGPTCIGCKERLDPRASRGWADGSQVLKIGPVHGQDVVEAVEIGLMNLPCPQIAEIKTAAARNRLGSKIGGLANLEAAGRRAVDDDPPGETAALKQPATASLSRRRAADVPQADE